ncbi:hypothetical protein PSAB6_250248 [Paraburkholderia sabiae]|nr:hypothetical protein PSAB6_250248 [Paraburkholderia sabiae]
MPRPICAFCLGLLSPIVACNRPTKTQASRFLIAGRSIATLLALKDIANPFVRRPVV